MKFPPQPPNDEFQSLQSMESKSRFRRTSTMYRSMGSQQPQEHGDDMHDGADYDHVTRSQEAASNGETANECSIISKLSKLKHMFGNVAFTMNKVIVIQIYIL